MDWPTASTHWAASSGLDQDSRSSRRSGGETSWVAAALAARLNVAVVDIEMPRQDGISAASELRRSLPSCRTLILTMYGGRASCSARWRGGGSSFVLKDASVEVLAAAIRRCEAGEDVVDPSLATRVLRAGPGPLSTREREILAACAEGLSTAELATRLGVSEGTVRNRVSEILGNWARALAPKPSSSREITAAVMALAGGLGSLSGSTSAEHALGPVKLAAVISPTA